LTVDPDGAPCICGNQGCLETIFSAGAIEAEARSIVSRGCRSALTDRFFQAPEKLTCRAVFEAADQGDALARWVVDRAVGVLGAAIASLAMAFDPEVIILGGQISDAGPALFEPLRRELAWRTRMLNREIPLLKAGVADATGVAGAAALLLSGLRPAA
jgi:glucokinase